MNKRKSAQLPRLLNYQITAQSGQRYSLSHRVVVKEREIAVIVITREPEAGVCEGIFFPDGAVRFMGHEELTCGPDGVFTSTGWVDERFELPAEVADLVRKIQAGPNAERKKLRAAFPCSFAKGA